MRWPGPAGGCRTVNGRVFPRKGRGAPYVVPRLRLTPRPLLSAPRSSSVTPAIPAWRAASTSPTARTLSAFRSRRQCTSKKGWSVAWSGKSAGRTIREGPAHAASPTSTESRSHLMERFYAAAVISPPLWPVDNGALACHKGQVSAAMLGRAPLARFVMLVVGLTVGGCAAFDRLSEEGGVLGRLASRLEESEPPETQASERVAEAPDSGAPLPYRPAEFDQHAADWQFTGHWTATRLGERVEVKGLIENRGGPAVQGITVELESAGSGGRQELPGLIAPGQMRPFYFTALLPGDERQARLSVVAVDRSSAPPERGVATPAALRREAPASPPSVGASFADHMRDHFFDLHWNTITKGGEIEVRGLVENRNGPMLRDVALLVRTIDAGGGTLKTKRLVLDGVLDRRDARAFAVTLPVSTSPERVDVKVEWYSFSEPRDR